MVKEKIKKTTKIFAKEARKATIGAIMAAFGFLIALVWRDVINEFVNKIVAALNIPESAAYYHLVSAMIITLICIVGILIVEKFAIKE